MKYLLLVLLASIITACVSGPPEAGINKAYSQNGAIVTSPSQPGWVLLEHTTNTVVFARALADNHSVVANTYYFWIGDAASDAVFFEKIIEGREQTNNKERFNQLVVDYHETTFKGQPCLKYRGVAEYQRDPTKIPDSDDYFSNIGYICRAPSDAASALLMEVSYRSSSKQLPVNIEHIADTFFADITLTDSD